MTSHPSHPNVSACGGYLSESLYLLFQLKQPEEIVLVLEAVVLLYLPYLLHLYFLDLCNKVTRVTANTTSTTAGYDTTSISGGSGVVEYQLLLVSLAVAFYFCS